MKATLAYIFHLAIATLAVPWFTLMFSGLTFSLVGHVFSSAALPQQFYSDHLFSLTTIVGLALAYTLRDTLPSKAALWVWIPSALGFVARVLSWRAAGSVLFRSGIVDHFFVADCQIQNWRELAFASRCADKLFLTPLVVGSLAYSAGAAIHLATQRRPSETDLTEEVVPTGLMVVSTRFRAIIAIVVTGWALAIGLHSQVKSTPSTWQWLSSGFLPTWAMVAINIAFWALVVRFGVVLAVGPSRKDEKVLLGAFIWGAMLTPVSVLLPRTAAGVHVVQTLLRLVAFLAAVSLLVSFSNHHASVSPSETA